MVHVTFDHLANRAFEVQHTTNLMDPSGWSALNVPENAPTFPATNNPASVPDTTGTAPEKYYRVRVFEP
jgi:hypothetical protein